MNARKAKPGPKSGAAGKGSAVTGAPVVSGEILPPRSLSQSALDIWHDELPVFQDVLVTRADQQIFARYCQCLAHIEEIMADIEKLSKKAKWTVKNAYGSDIENPIWKTLGRFETQLSGLVSKLGMTPKDRRTVAPNKNVTNTTKTLDPKAQAIQDRRDRLVKRARGKTKAN